MPRFTLPQFIEREPKIVGPFTFKQLIYVGIAGVISFFFYLIIPFHYFILITIFLILGALALAFLTIGGRSLPTVLVNFFKFRTSPKIYLWGKKEFPIKVFEKKEEIKKEIPAEKPPLKIAKESQIKKLVTKIEIRSR